MQYSVDQMKTTVDRKQMRCKHEDMVGEGNT